MTKKKNNNTCIALMYEKSSYPMATLKVIMLILYDVKMFIVYWNSKIIVIFYLQKLIAF